MKKFVSYGSRVTARSCRCADCGHILFSPKSKAIQRCPDFDKSPHHQRGWYVLTLGQDS